MRPSRIVTERLDAWLDARSAGERALVVAEAAAGLCALGVAFAAAWRCLAAPGPAIITLTHPVALLAAAGFGCAALVGRRLPAGQARSPDLRPALSDALAAALGKRDRADLEAVVRDAVGPDRIRAALEEQLTPDALSTRIEEIAQAARAEATADDAGDADAALDEVVAALDTPAERARLARWLTRLLIEREELIDGIARPVTKRLLRDAWFDRPFSWGKLNKQTRRFLDRPKGEAWAEAVVARVLADLSDRPPRARAVRQHLVPVARRVAAGRLSTSIGDRLRGDARIEGLLEEGARAAAGDVQPALLGALGHMVDERAVSAVEAVEAARLRTLLTRSAAATARRLRVACFVGGAALGLLPALWS